MKTHLYKFILLVSAISLVFIFLSCSPTQIQREVPADTENAENRFFSLDFENANCELSDVENHFFTTFPHDDPTEGDVVYDRKKWANQNMIKLEKGEGLYLYIKDRKDSIGYDSFRLTSKAYFNLTEQTPRILFVFKGSLPSARGIWPAWWLNGSYQDSWIYRDSEYIQTDQDLDSYSGKGYFYDTPSLVNSTDWPGAGEIDIIETINGDNLIHNTIHTCPQMCDSKWNNNGQIVNCANAKAGDPNSGCSGKPYALTNPEGTFASLWEKESIKFFYWKPTENVRQSGGPLSRNPDPDLWNNQNLMNEVKLLDSKSECDNRLHAEWQCKSCEGSDACLFKNMKMIFNTTLCGKWAGNKFDSTEHSLTNCRNYILGEGKQIINNQFLKIEYISVGKLESSSGQ